MAVRQEKLFSVWSKVTGLLKGLQGGMKEGKEKKSKL
jgi:hypothetical protein